MTTSAETAGNGSEETEAANKTDQVVSVAEAFGFGERVLDEVEASIVVRQDGEDAAEDEDKVEDVGEVRDLSGLFDEHIRKSPFVQVDGQELALRDHMRSSKPATSILELVTKGEDGKEQVVGTLGSSKVWEHDSEGKHFLVPESEGVPPEFATTVSSVAEAVHARIEAQQQLSAAA